MPQAGSAIKLAPGVVIKLPGLPNEELPRGWSPAALLNPV